MGLTGHQTVLDEGQIAALQGYAQSDLDQAGTGVLLARPPIGFVVDADFAARHPGAIVRLTQIAPALAGSEGVFILSADGAGLLDWMLARAFRMSDDVLNSAINVQMEVARLQSMLRDQVEALENAQRLVNQSTPPQPKLCVLLAPGSSTLSPKDLPNITSIVQNSKREFSVVHAFELHVAEADSGQNPLTVTLTTAYSQDMVGTWTLPASTLHPGWNRFDVPFRSKALDEPVLIEIRWHGDTAPGTVFSLGEITADPRLGCVLSNGTVEAHSLAVRLYEGALGLRLPYRGWGLPADGAEADSLPEPVRDDGQVDLRQEGGTSEVMISELLKDAAPFNESEHNKDLLKYIDPRLGVQVHPIGNRVHIAVVRNVKVKHARAIVADLLLAHDAAPRVEFGVFAAPAGAVTYTKSAPEPRRPNMLRFMNKSGRKSSEEVLAAQAEWLALKGHQKGQVVFDLIKTDAEVIDIFLMTRPGGTTTNYAWAHFVNLTVVRKEAVA
ncbi:DUF6212 domain-containing protein [Methylobacterium sp. Leaf118]|uniref:DUF6212 domain-containing protein n=1 Tax=Methylobacterium sp. Leaf118 TaxID=2876562 RepID=UPI001E4BCD6F|nr:DUF6212 domain-containing protein [Methylobacterium sp. Leaf118]